MLINKLSIRVTLKSSFLLDSREIRQKQMNDSKINDFFRVELLSPLTFFPVKAKNSNMFTHSYFKMVFSFVMIGSISRTWTMPERNKTGVLSLNVGKLINLHLVSCNSKIPVAEFLFHYTFNPSANLNPNVIWIW